ncbi:protein translocase subunit SecF [Halorubellus sp. JP-L1]|uniref:protein translocase subunit SecF n=1 Tax=Halorubellus sp. JP-L1 TaxID=2715753 RepID=UPI0014091175|nr:protein translocase subunit SecF [Halorubellus sp. JP-L1]NHN41547.1 protein translocase subunit SecF [Halorubellus sp. JP-L1]
MSKFEVPEIDYERYTNRQLAAIPVGILVVALVVLAGLYVTTGSPVPLGIDFTGGTELTVQTDTPRDELAAAFSEEPVSIQGTAGTESPQYIVTFADTGDSASGSELASQARENLEPTCSNADNCAVVQSQQSTTPRFASSAQQTAFLGIGLAFAGMSVLAFAFFRTFVPSVAIVISAFSDIVIPLALMGVLGIKLSLGTVAALLMLIGYSVDSDILLNNHILRREGGFYESTRRAMRTGVTMTLTSLSAMAVMAVTAYLFGIELMASIGLVLVLGLATDLMNTYMLNLSLLRWYQLGEVSN